MLKYAQYQAWKNTLFQNVNTAADSDDDEALLWVKQVEEYDTYPDEHFEQVPEKKFRRLDKKLSAACQRAAQGQLGHRITALVTKVTKEGRSARGREILRMIYRYYLSNRTAEQVYMITDLQKVKLSDPTKGNLEKF